MTTAIDVDSNLTGRMAEKDSQARRIDIATVHTVETISRDYHNQLASCNRSSSTIHNRNTKWQLIKMTASQQVRTTLNRRSPIAQQTLLLYLMGMYHSTQLIPDPRSRHTTTNVDCKDRAMNLCSSAAETPDTNHFLLQGKV